MTLFGSIDRANNAPKFNVDSQGNKGTDQFGNTVFGVDAVEAGITSGVAHQGWIQRTLGTGPLSTITISSGGSGYANADTILVSSSKGINAAATLVTNATGGITSVTITNYGNGFVGTETVTITTSGGTDANLTPTYTGRSGRVTNEVLVACKITGDAENTVFPNA